MRSTVGKLATRAAIEPFLAERKQLANTDRYARDPFAHVDEGHILILDLETLQEVRMEFWPHQREIISAWIDLDYLHETGILRLDNTHEEKSRQMGVTWVVAYVCWWALTYHPLPGLALSRKVGEICDSGPTTDSFFGKIKFIHERVPERYQAPLEWVGGNDPSIRNPTHTSGFLAGEGSNANPGRGGKYGYIFLDEMAYMPWGEMVHSAVSRACPSGRLYNSTPSGPDNVYYRLRQQRPPNFTFLRHHWSIHPVYGIDKHVAGSTPESCEQCRLTIAGEPWRSNDPLSGGHRFPGRLTSPWYEVASVELTDEQCATELDIDYERSLSARVYPEFSEEVHVVDQIELLPIDTTPTYLSFDYGMDMTAVGIWQDTPDALVKVGEFEQSDLIPEQVAEGIRDVLRRLGAEERLLAPNWTRRLRAIGDPAGEARSAVTGTSVVQAYAKLGFQIVSRPQSIQKTFTATKRLLHGRPKHLRISRHGCPATIEHFQSNRFPTDREGVRKPGVEPLNDRHNHMMRADAYLITFLFPPPEVHEAIHVELRKEATGKFDPGLSYDMTL